MTTPKSNAIPKTVFRVVGGYANRHTMIKYEIIPYLLIREFPTNYVLGRNGRTETHRKRTTSNTEWFENIEDALSRICQRIDMARVSVNTSLEKMCDRDFSDQPWVNWVYVVRFQKETFEIFRYQIAPRVYKKDTDAIKTVEKNITGKHYLYPHISQPHNPELPFERWISKDLGTLLGVVRMYGEARLKYLHSTKQHLIDWVRIFEKERACDGKNNG